MNYSVNHSLDHSVNHPVDLSVNHSVDHPVNYSADHSVNRSVNHSVNHSVNLSVRHSVDHSVEQSVDLSVVQTRTRACLAQKLSNIKPSLLNTLCFKGFMATPSRNLLFYNVLSSSYCRTTGAMRGPGLLLLPLLDSIYISYRPYVDLT